MLQVSRQPGLFAVFSEILQFDGDEIYYMRGRGSWASGSSSSHAVLPGLDADWVGSGWRAASLAGSRCCDRWEDKIIFITEDDSNSATAPQLGGAPDRFPEPAALMAGHEGESWLFTDWAPTIRRLTELDLYLMDARTRSRSSCIPDDIGQAKLLEGLDLRTSRSRLIKCPMNSQPGRCSTTRTSPADVRRYPEGTGRGRLGHEHASDAAPRSDIIDRKCDQTTKPFVVSELLSDKFTKIADESDVRDIVVSSGWCRCYLCNFGRESRTPGPVSGSLRRRWRPRSISSLPRTTSSKATTSFMTIVDAANERGEIAIGYRLQAESGLEEKAFGVYVNPRRMSR